MSFDVYAQCPEWYLIIAPTLLGTSWEQKNPLLRLQLTWSVGARLYRLLGGTGGFGAAPCRRAAPAVPWSWKGM
ncbi:MAG TPA: hypothetical protein VF221_11960 [Chloroflexota bacterium]